MSAVRKHDISIHITTEYMDKFPILNTNKQNDYARSKISKELGGCKATISQYYCAAGSFCVYESKYCYSFNFRKLYTVQRNACDAH